MNPSCKNCGTGFEITQDDLDFYDRVSPVFAGKKYPVPPPTHCPDCRFQRRILWRREHSLKSRVCDSCKKSIISVHTAEAPYPVYCLTCWWSDKWDPMTYGIDLDPSQSFLRQFAGLLKTVPQITMMNDNGVGSENCEYSHDFAFGKNCYLITGCWELQDCYYCDCNCFKSRHLFDCYSVHFSELAYDSIASQHLYRCAYLNHCENCHDCLFGIDLKGCHDCIGCIGLRQKQFCIFNEQLSEADYRKKAAGLHLDSYQGVKMFQAQFEQWILAFPTKSVHLVHCENCMGDDLFNCKDVIGFQQDGAEYCKFIVHGIESKNSYDLSQTGRAEWCYEGTTPDNSYMTHFTTWCWKSKYILYSDNCHHCEHLLGCVGLKRKKYCILNKQYTKEEYERLAGEIITGMMRDGQWGEFFPMTMSPYCYNETAAKEYFPQNKEQVAAMGLAWRDDDPREYKTPTATVSDRIADVPDSITNELLACQSCRRNYKILTQELNFYRDLHIPAPPLCYDCRYGERIQRRNPRKLWQRNCAKCKREIQTTYAPERPETVYCEECYLKEVY